MNTSLREPHNHIVQWIFIISVGVLCLIPIINDLGHVFPELPPKGMASAKPYIPLTKSSLLNRSWQKRLEARAKQESGLWSPLMRLGNEIHYIVFDQISPYHNESVLLGKERHLFQNAHLASLNNVKSVDVSAAEKRFANLKILQEKLSKRGTAVVFLITPNLISLYPELVPQIYLDPQRHYRKNAYEQVKEILQHQALRYVDAFELLRSRKEQYPFRLFARSASHWNDIGSCLVLEAINKEVIAHGHVGLRRFSCNKWHLEDVPRVKDKDLADITNVIYPEKFYDPTPYIDIEYKDPISSKTPRVLLVGTSYLFALSDHLHDWGLSNDQLVYFYNKRWRRGGKRHFHAILKDKVDWKDLLSREIIIINVGVGTPAAPGYGFVEEALQAMNKLGW